MITKYNFDTNEIKNMLGGNTGVVAMHKPGELSSSALVALLTLFKGIDPDKVKFATILIEVSE